MGTELFRPTGKLYHDDGTDNPKFLGTCFLYKTRHLLVTAAHCIGALEARSLRVQMAISGTDDLRVLRVAKHPTADLATIEVAHSAIKYLQPFTEIDRRGTYGSEFSAIGFPEDAHGDSVLPTPRFFRGHLQRFMDHRSASGYHYRAAELSIGAPGGLSGGPVVIGEQVPRLFGIVCENLESRTLLYAVEDVEEDGKLFRETIRSVINYAVCLRLESYESWLDQWLNQDDGVRLNRDE